MKKPTPEMEANRCAISARDCDAARKYLEAYLGLGKKGDYTGTSDFDTLREGLLLAAIVSYSRAFTDSKGELLAARLVRVDLEKVFNKDASKIKMHKTVLDKRHNAVAHSTWKYHNTKVLETNVGIARMYPAVRYNEGINIQVFRGMAATMRDHFWEGALERDIAIKAKSRKEGLP